MQPRLLVLLAVAATALSIPAASSTSAPPGRAKEKDQAASRAPSAAAGGWKKVNRALAKIRTVEAILAIRRNTWECQTAAYLARSEAEYGRAALLRAGSGMRRFVADRWRSLRSDCEIVKRRTLPDVSDWLTAVKVVQRAYPGTDWWLTSCSASEGGHGAWVPNRQGSGASGWMQFLDSTFDRMFEAAHADVTSRGFRVPASADDWYSPLAQALAGAWGYENGRRGEWFGSGC